MNSLKRSEVQNKDTLTTWCWGCPPQPGWAPRPGRCCSAGPRPGSPEKCHHHHHHHHHLLTLCWNQLWKMFHIRKTSLSFSPCWSTPSPPLYLPGSCCSHLKAQELSGSFGYHYCVIISKEYTMVNVRWQGSDFILFWSKREIGGGFKTSTFIIPNVHNTYVRS